MPQSDNLVLLGIAHDELEAAIWRDILAAEGIPVLAKTPDVWATFGVPPRKDSIRVFIAPKDEKRARWLLGEAIGEPLPSADDAQGAHPAARHERRMEDRSRAEP